MSSPYFQDQWFPHYSSGSYVYGSPYSATAGSASTSRAADFMCPYCSQSTACACYSRRDEQADNYAGPSWSQGQPTYKLDVGYTHSPSYQTNYMRGQSVASSRSDVDTPSSIYSPAVFTPVSDYDFESSPPTIVAQDGQNIYDAFMQAIDQYRPSHGVDAPKVAHNTSSLAPAAQTELIPLSNCPTAAPGGSYTNPQIGKQPAPSVDDLLSHLYSSQSASNASALASSSLASSEFTFSLHPSQLSLPEQQDHVPILHQPRPVRPIGLLRKPDFSLTDVDDDERNLPSSSSCGALGDLSQTSASASLRETWTGASQAECAHGSDDEFDDSEDDSSEFDAEPETERCAYEEQEHASRASPLPLLCQPVPDEVRYQTQCSP
ncbi:hypothetical protein GLOTRDRAFT_108816, partial [Gloeophyllum trabeum ATCC 11539]